MKIKYYYANTIDDVKQMLSMKNKWYYANGY